MTDGPLVWFRRLPVAARGTLVENPHRPIPPELVDAVKAAGAPLVRATGGAVASQAMFLTPEYQNFLHATKLHLAWVAAADLGDAGDMEQRRTTYETFVLANDEAGDTSAEVNRTEHGVEL